MLYFTLIEDLHRNPEDSLTLRVRACAETAMVRCEALIRFRHDFTIELTKGKMVFSKRAAERDAFIKSLYELWLSEGRPKAISRCWSPYGEVMTQQNQPAFLSSVRRKRATAVEFEAIAHAHELQLKKELINEKADGGDFMLYMVESRALTDAHTDGKINGIRITQVVEDHMTDEVIGYMWAESHDPEKRVHIVDVPNSMGTPLSEHTELLAKFDTTDHEAFIRDGLHMLAINAGSGSISEDNEHGRAFDRYLIDEII